jgi:large subunit ribosomal protein L25
MTTTLEAQPRVAAGKTEATRLRRDGKIPAVAYGKSMASTPIAVAPKDVLAILKSERGKNTIIAMKLKDQSITVMIKDFTYHPVSRALEHVDFVAVRPDEEVDVDVPLIALGKAAGIAQGGVLRQVYRFLPVRCIAEKVPAKLEVEISHLNMGDHIETKEVKVPEGVKIRLPQEQTLIAIVAPEKEKVEEEAPAAAAAGAVPAAGAAPAAGATPAAGAAPAAEAKKEEKKK